GDLPPKRGRSADAATPTCAARPRDERSVYPEVSRGTEVSQPPTRKASTTVLNTNTSAVTIVMRSRLRSTTVDPAIDPPIWPPNMSDRPPPRPAWRSTKRMRNPDDTTSSTSRTAFSTKGKLTHDLRHGTARHRRSRPDRGKRRRRERRLSRP